MKLTKEVWTELVERYKKYAARLEQAAKAASGEVAEQLRKSAKWHRDAVAAVRTVSPSLSADALNKAVELRIAQGYTELICSHPFFASILLRLRRTADPSARTMWTDGRSLGYGPVFVLAMSFDEIVGVLAHEVGHVAGLHPWRREWRKPKPWNIACDHVVNHIVIESGLKLPDGALEPIPNKAAEELYQAPEGGGSGGGGDEGDGESDGWDDDPGGCGEVREAKNPDGSSLSEAEHEQQMAEAKVMVQQALNAAKRAGKLPAGLARMVDEALEPRVPWKEILARFIDGNARHDYCWSRPNRRYFSDGVLFPSLWSPGYGEVVMAPDASGSIDQEMLKEIGSELIGCLETYQERGQPVELTVAWFDHAVYPQVVGDAVDLQPRGGGGTSFRVVFEWVAEEGLTPRAIILITDGQCSDFGEPPECPVLWILTAKNDAFEPPFGEIACVLNE